MGGVDGVGLAFVEGEGEAGEVGVTCAAVVEFDEVVVGDGIAGGVGVGFVDEDVGWWWWRWGGVGCGEGGEVVGEHVVGWVVGVVVADLVGEDGDEALFVVLQRGCWLEVVGGWPTGGGGWVGAGVGAVEEKGGGGEGDGFGEGDGEGGVEGDVGGVVVWVGGEDGGWGVGGGEEGGEGEEWDEGEEGDDGGVEELATAAVLDHGFPFGWCWV